MLTSDEIIVFKDAEIEHLKMSLRIRDTLLHSKGLDLKCKDFESDVSSRQQSRQEKDTIIATLKARHAELNKFLTIKEIEVKVKEVEVYYTENGYSLESGSKAMRERCEEIQRVFQEIEDEEEKDRLRILFGRLKVKYRELEEREIEKKEAARTDVRTNSSHSSDRRVPPPPAAESTEAQSEAHREFFPPLEPLETSESEYDGEDTLFEELSTKLKVADDKIEDLDGLYFQKEGELVELRMKAHRKQELEMEVKDYREFLNIRPVEKEANENLEKEAENHGGFLDIVRVDEEKEVQVEREEGPSRW